MLPGHLKKDCLSAFRVKLDKSVDDFTWLISIQKVTMGFGCPIWIHHFIRTFLNGSGLFAFAGFLVLGDQFRKMLHFASLFPCAHGNVESLPFNQVVFLAIPGLLSDYPFDDEVVFLVPGVIEVVYLLLYVHLGIPVLFSNYFSFPFLFDLRIFPI